MKIVITSNCQTGPLASCLRVMIDKSHIVPLPLPVSNDFERVSLIKEELQTANIWITSGLSEIALDLPNIRIFKVPALVFSAFHPDLIYVTSTKNPRFYPHYNSRIVAWSYKNNLEICNAEKLFNHYTFKRLGYFDRWDGAVELLKNIFIMCDFSIEEYNLFFKKIQRFGIFMHSINHPKIEPIIELSKLLIKKMDLSSNLSDREVIIKDDLTNKIWPVYPEIGNELGFNGSYVWRFDNLEINGISDYIKFSYENYMRHEILPEDLEIVADSFAPFFEDALREQL